MRHWRKKNLRTAFSNLMFGCGFPFPLSSSHFIVPVHLGSLDRASRTTLDATPLIRCISPMISVSQPSHPFHLPVPRNSEFVVAANLFERFFFALYGTVGLLLGSCPGTCVMTNATLCLWLQLGRRPPVLG